VNAWTGFASQFTHLSEGTARVENVVSPATRLRSLSPRLCVARQHASKRVIPDQGPFPVAPDASVNIDGHSVGPYHPRDPLGATAHQRMHKT
jgi:hypothetical protein